MTATTNAELFKRLADPFPYEDILWKPQKVSKDGRWWKWLPYFNARAVFDRLDEVCGVENWTDSIKAVPRGDGRIAWIRTIAIRLPETDGWISKSEVADDTSIEAGKGGASDALKRCLVAWGCRYMYRMPDFWCEAEKKGSGYERPARDAYPKISDIPKKFLPKEPGKDPLETPLCECSKPAVERQVNDEKKKSHGKWFWGCAKGKDDGGCAWFRWNPGHDLQKLAGELDEHDEVQY